MDKIAVIYTLLTPKKTKKMRKNIFVTLAALVVMLFTSCSKDIELEGTYWNWNTDVDITDEILEEMGEDEAEVFRQMIAPAGGKVILNFSIDMNFLTEKSGEMILSAKIKNADRMPSIVQSLFREFNWTEKEAFSYTFDGEKGVLTVEDSDTQPFTYNEDNETITMSVDDPDMVETFGTSTLVFKQKK